MPAPQSREPAAPVATEVLVQALVGVDAPELPDAFDGQDLTVAEGRLGATLAQPPAGSQSSIRQYTVMSSVVASMLDPRTRGDGLTTKRTGVTTHRNPHTGLASDDPLERCRYRRRSLLHRADRMVEESQAKAEA